MAKPTDSLLASMKLEREILNQIDLIEKHAWELHGKLANAKYDSRWSQFSDMEKLGALARKARILGDALVELKRED